MIPLSAESSGRHSNEEIVELLGLRHRSRTRIVTRVSHFHHIGAVLPTTKAITPSIRLGDM